MIPIDYITEWREHAPWIQDAQVEQDLILSRALVDLFTRKEIREALAFRGGTALYKLHLEPMRYSEDIDLVQVVPGPIGSVLDSMREVLDPWLGSPRYDRAAGGVTFVYRAESEGPPSLPIRLKIEINSREHFSVFGMKEVLFKVESRWFSGSTSIRTFELDELLGTKLRALFQRKKGRDLFDLWFAQDHGEVRPDRVVECFRRYLDHSGYRVSRAAYEENLAGKLSDRRFLGDIEPLLTPGASWDVDDAVQYVREELLARLPGEPWKGSEGKST